MLTEHHRCSFRRLRKSPALLQLLRPGGELGHLGAVGTVGSAGHQMQHCLPHRHQPGMQRLACPPRLLLHSRALTQASPLASRAAAGGRPSAPTI